MPGPNGVREGVLCPSICLPLATSLRSGLRLSTARKTAPRPFGRTLENAGCKLKGLWYAFGEGDGSFALIEAPDNVTGASISIAIGASGAFSKYETTVLMTQDELLKALERAQDVAYVAPGAAVHA